MRNIKVTIASDEDQSIIKINRRKAMARVFAHTMKTALATQIIKDFGQSLVKPNDGVILKDFSAIDGCTVVLTSYKQDPEHIWVVFLASSGDYKNYTRSFPNDHKGYEDARRYYVKCLANFGTSSSPAKRNGMLNFFKQHSFAMAQSVQAFEDSLTNFGLDSVALAYNMAQTKTRMSKEAIAARIQRHKEMIKIKKEKIKVWEKQKKASQMNPDKVQKISARITKQGDRIAKHNEAIKYYSMLAKIKPPKDKVNPANRGANKVINLRKKDMVK